MSCRSLSTALFLILALPAHALDQRAVTELGRDVLLHEDGTWQYIDKYNVGEKDAVAGKEAGIAVGAAARKAELTVEKWQDFEPASCRLGVRMTNWLTAPIRTLVLRFTVYKSDIIAFDTVSRGFTFIKPTTSQYHEVAFRGIRCDEVHHVQVSGARNCHVGDLTKYSEGAHPCLSLVRVQPSSLLDIGK